jgi:bifunctional ADP-heptose synthase (sugar kinase/adenylyltransferase)
VGITESLAATEVIRLLRPDVYVKGSEYAEAAADVTGGIAEEAAAVTAVGGRMHFTTEITFSSSSLLNLHFDVYPEEAQTFLRDFRARYSADTVITALQALRPLRALLIGDTIIDEYHYVQSMGKSPKELLIGTRYLREEHFPGGILACANHIAGFCDQVDLVTVLGARDSREPFIRQHLRPNVRPRFFTRPRAGTVVKRRFVDQAFLSKMFEVAFLDDQELEPAISDDIADSLRGTLDQYDLVLVADYGHGFLTGQLDGGKTKGALIHLLQVEARFLAVNVQTNSANSGFNLVTKYFEKGAAYVCIDEPEARLALGNRAGEIEDVIRAIAKAMSADRVAVTRGHHGSVTYQQDADRQVETIPVFSREIVDRMGAGDAYLAVTAPCAALGYPMDLVGFVGNAVGALAVRIIGNRSAVEPVPLFKFITALLKQ